MVLDVAVLAVLMMFLLFGIRTGLARMALRMGSVLLSLLLAWVLYPAFSGALTRAFHADLSEMLRVNYIEPNVGSILSGTEGVPAFLTGFVRKGAEAAAQAAAQSMSDSIAALLLNVAAFLGVFFASRLILFFAARFLDMITRLPVLKQFNKLGGGILGLLEGGIAVYLALALVFLLTPIRDSELFRQQLRQSRLANQMYNDNIIIKLAAPESMAEQNEGGTDIEIDQRSIGE